MIAPAVAAATAAVEPLALQIVTAAAAAAVAAHIQTAVMKTKLQ